MPKDEPLRIRLGVSSCLLGERVRHDGGHKRDDFLTDVLGAFIDWVPVCPEVEIGLGAPRDTIRLVGRHDDPRLVVARTGEDLTARMTRFAAAKATALGELDGYVFKRASPTCGLFRVRVYGDDGALRGAGRGLYAAAFTRCRPLVPVEEEGRLTDPVIRENFIERVFAAARWRVFVVGRPAPGDLVAFHTAQKLAVLAHSPAHYARLGRLVADAGRRLGRGRAAAEQALTEYGAVLMGALAVRATRARHVNVLQHVAGFFKRDLERDDRAEVTEVIEEYRRGLVPLVVPLTLVRHHVRRLRLAYLADQVYLNPHPKELMLRNHV
jgi:uncharacterized protein YbgA (DUF1722 family)/uncharacterized protein YbbK (DUF523 family)